MYSHIPEYEHATKEELAFIKDSQIKKRCIKCRGKLIPVPYSMWPEFMKTSPPQVKLLHIYTCYKCGLFVSRGVDL